MFESKYMFFLSTVVTFWLTKNKAFLKMLTNFNIVSHEGVLGPLSVNKNKTKKLREGLIKYKVINL